ncbi:hypothetical protein [Streptomyces gilvosporeus]|uniref:Uncharacterized protein n=1 Tax=Streptomyces gilvosporeus TaxID=553510 RepID=A0A1V0TT89_9ACTN|nr:hypothetical protein [Streptomyces gilvosporeus]ARF55978.1 hypothetical protein B1H19_18905 [Streptomyces gilvosporeus]
MNRPPSAMHFARAARLARELDRLAPGIVAVRTTPVFVDDLPRGPRIATFVHLVDDEGLVLAATPDVHRTAYRLVRDAFSSAEWSHEYRYDLRRGDLFRCDGAALPPGVGGVE